VLCALVPFSCWQCLSNRFVGWTDGSRGTVWGGVGCLLIVHTLTTCPSKSPVPVIAVLRCTVVCCCSRRRVGRAGRLGRPPTHAVYWMTLLLRSWRLLVEILVTRRIDMLPGLAMCLCVALIVIASRPGRAPLVCMWVVQLSGVEWELVSCMQKRTQGATTYP